MTSVFREPTEAEALAHQFEDTVDELRRRGVPESELIRRAFELMLVRIKAYMFKEVKKALDESG